jgi:hypothetical protein
LDKYENTQGKVIIQETQVGRFPKKWTPTQNRRTPNKGKRTQVGRFTKKRYPNKLKRNRAGRFTRDSDPSWKIYQQGKMTQVGRF